MKRLYTVPQDKFKPKKNIIKLNPIKVRNELHFMSQRDIPSIVFKDKSKIIPRKQKYKNSDISEF